MDFLSAGVVFAFGTSAFLLIGRKYAALASVFRTGRQKAGSRRAALEKTAQLFAAIASCFVLGYSLRATKSGDFVVAGYLLTDAAFLSAYLLIAAAGLFGQLKYWRLS